MDRFQGLLGSGKAKTDFVPVDALIHPDAAIAKALWRDRPADGLRLGRDVPSRAIARLLSRIVILAPTADGEDYRVHLAGEVIKQRFQRDVTGLRLSELFDDPMVLKPRLAGLKDAMSSGTPRMVRIIHRAGGVEILRNETVVMPVTAPNGTDRWALAFAFYF